MKNREYIEYTYKHRKIVIYLANKYVKENKEETMNQIEFHDNGNIILFHNMLAGTGIGSKNFNNSPANDIAKIIKNCFTYFTFLPSFYYELYKNFQS